MRPYSVPAIARRLSAELGSTGGGPIAKARNRLVENFGGIEELLRGGDARPGSVLFNQRDGVAHEVVHHAVVG
jgi:hypothetical protein